MSVFFLPGVQNFKIGARLSLFYVAIFLFLGVVLPFWPVWLKYKELSGVEIGLVLASGPWVKLLGNPLWARWADARGNRKGPMILLSLAMLASFCLFFLTAGFWKIFVVALLWGFFFAGLMPLGEGLTLMAARNHQLDYGRIRLWGSLAFIAASSLGGLWLGGRPAQLILWALIAGQALLLLSCLSLPDAHPDTRRARKSAMGLFLRHPLFLAFLVSAGLIQASHSVLYGFGTLHWRSAGLADGYIGWLWAEGVIAEVFLFAFSGAVLRRIGPVGLLLAASAGGMVRWLGLGLVVDPVGLLFLQALHGLSFGAAHIGAMHFIARAAPASLSATALGLYSGLAMGAGMGLSMTVGGYLYQNLAAMAFSFMALFCAVGGLAALYLKRRWEGGELTL